MGDSQSQSEQKQCGRGTVKYLEASIWFLIFLYWMLQAGRAHRHHEAVRCLWGRFPETCMKMSSSLSLSEQAGCMSSDWWWNFLEKTVVMPSSCIPTSKVQLKWFELCNFFIGVDAKPKLFCAGRPHRGPSRCWTTTKYVRESSSVCVWVWTTAAFLLALSPRRRQKTRSWQRWKRYLSWFWFMLNANSTTDPQAFEST